MWAWFARFLPERGLLALYRATFFYGVCRMISWSVWAHVIEDFPYDLSWTGPWWIGARSLPARQPVDRRPGDAGAARGDLLGGEQALGADGPRRGEAPGEAGEPGRRLRRDPRRRRGDDVGAEDLDRVEVEAAQERHRA